MDSCEMLEFFNELEFDFKIKIDFDEIDLLLEKKPILTVKDIVNYIDGKQ
jgi:acyl carrier protein